MTVTAADVHFDLYDRETYLRPYDTFRRLRDEAPIYRNEELGYYVVSRHEDVQRVLGDRKTFISGNGMSYSLISQDFPMPSGMFINEDPPHHTMHRSIVARLFTPRAVSGLEPEIRRLCSEIVDGVEGRDSFDFAQDVALHLPVQVIGMLVGVPREDQRELLAIFQKNMHAEVHPDEPKGEVMASISESSAWFAEYLDWREKNPSDDVMTQLMAFEFDDEDGTRRRLRRDEIIIYLTLITAAGSDTTATGMSWAGSTLGEHPDQRRELVADPSLIPQAVEEVLRYEAPAYHFCRWVAEDVEIHGRVVPADSILVVLPPSANHDDRKWDDPERFDIHRTPGQIMSFGFGPHFCLGANLARLEVRLMLETLLPRIPDWTCDLGAAQLTTGIDSRGWSSLPVHVG
jgi:cytochrome P450